ncbi:hypothetical protein [Wolinella succinogenes]|uniref:hypothetical protein n=1 Tax=Wolinella succinogenes TaxID=844 RepID=UPI002FCB3FA0
MKITYKMLGKYLGVKENTVKKYPTKKRELMLKGLKQIMAENPIIRRKMEEKEE